MEERGFKMSRKGICRKIVASSEERAVENKVDGNNCLEAEIDGAIWNKLPY